MLPSLFALFFLCFSRLWSSKEQSKSFWTRNHISRENDTTMSTISESLAIAHVHTTEDWSWVWETPNIGKLNWNLMSTASTKKAQWAFVFLYQNHHRHWIFSGKICFCWKMVLSLWLESRRNVSRMWNFHPISLFEHFHLLSERSVGVEVSGRSVHLARKTDISNFSLTVERQKRKF